MLLVDDRPENLVALTAILEDLPVRLVRALSGDEAVELCSREEFAVVILDVKMPGSDGPTTARRLKALGATRLTPIIFLTALEADRRRVHDGYASGAVDYLFKPVDPDILRDKVAAFADLDRNRRAEHWRQRRRYADQAARAAEAAFRDGDERFRLLAEAVPVMVWTATPDGRVDYVNPFAWNYVGAPEGHPTDTLFPAHLHADDLAPMLDLWGRTIAAGEPFEAEVRIWSAERAAFRRHIVRARPRRDAAGVLLGWVGASADVEDSKRAEEEAHELLLSAEREARIASDDARAEAERARQRVTFLLEAGAALSESLDYLETLRTLVRVAVPFLADFAIVDMAGPDGRLQRIAWAHGDVRQQPLLDRLAEWCNAAGGSLPTEHVAAMSAEPRIVAAVGEDGLGPVARDEAQLDLVRRLAPRSLMTVPLRARGRTLGLMIFCMSRSRRAYSPADLELAVELVRRAAVAVDTARLYEAAQEANSAKAAFLAAVSHDLRQPLNASLGFLDIALMGLRGEVSPMLREDLERVRRNQQHLLALINDVLSFARIEAGQLLVRREVITLDRILESLPSLVAPQADAKGVALAIEPCPAGLMVLADHERVLQIFTNLLTNAIKATAGGGRVSVDLEIGGDVVLVHVRDTGIGIAPEMRDRIFEPFVQVARSLNRPEEGIGLGLSISRNLARAMGGELTVESTPGLGSTFTVRLPRAPMFTPPVGMAAVDSLPH